MTSPPPTPVPSVSMIRSDAPLPAPSRHSASAAALPSFSTPAGMRVALPRAIGEVDAMEREVDRAERNAGPPIDVERDAVPDRGRAVGEQILDDAVDRAQHLRLVSVGRRDLDRAADRAVARDESCEDLRPAEVDPDNTLFTHVAATITARMPEQEKPYRVYKGGRAKGKVPLQRPTDGRSKDSGRGAPASAPRPTARGTLDHALARCSCWFSPSSGWSRATSRCPVASRTQTTAFRRPRQPS